MLESILEVRVLAIEGRAQRVEQIRCGQEERGDAERDALIGDGRRQVRLAAAVASPEQQPSVEGVGEVPTGLEGAFQRLLVIGGEVRPATRQERLECHLLKIVEMAEPIELLPDPAAHSGLAASARFETAEVRVIQRPLAAQVAQPMAMWAIRIAGVAGGRVSGQ